MKENEEKNSSTNQIFKGKNKENNEGLHYKKIKVKHLKKDDIETSNYEPNINLENINKIKINPNMNKMNQNLDKDDEENNKNFVFEDLNNQLDEILENIENDGIEEINKKIKFLKEDKNMFNTISYNDDIKDNDWNFKKIDNKNKHIHKRNKFPNHDKNNTMSNFKHFNHNNKYLMSENRNITNHRYLFTSMNNNTYRSWKEENNCNNDDDSDDDDKNLNKTNISLFYKYNNYYNSKKNEDE